MNILKSKALSVYIILGVLMCVIEYKDMVMLRYIVKPLLCLTLIVYVVNKNKNSPIVMFKILLTSLLFAFLGDTFLLFPDLFILGLVAFLCAHVCYIVIFYNGAKGNLLQLFDRKHYFEFANQNKINLKQDMLLRLTTVTAVLFDFYLYSKLSPNLHELKIPVIIYMIVITLMFILALHRNYKNGYMAVTIGALFFLLSDSSLAIDKFLTHFNHASFLIMTTYILAQFLIVTGLTNRYPSE